jgi:hypothetical protein
MVAEVWRSEATIESRNESATCQSATVAYFAELLKA